MPVTNHYTIGGQILGESTGGVKTEYMHDALGSVTATTDGSGAVQNTYRYSPYGQTIAKTGTAPDPKFGWVGTQGYRKTGRAHSEAYVRARHYGLPEARWTCMDPLWPREEAY